MLTPTQHEPAPEAAPEATEAAFTEQEMAARIKALERAYMRAVVNGQARLARVLLDSLRYQWDNWKE